MNCPPFTGLLSNLPFFKTINENQHGENTKHSSEKVQRFYQESNKNLKIAKKKYLNKC